MDTISVCVFAASSPRVDEAYVRAAYQLGTLMAQRGWHCFNGAGSDGLMRAVSDGALQHGGQVTGVIPKFMVDNGWCYNALQQVIVTVDMHERKMRLHELTNAIVALPGGCGTLEELLEAITWRQLALAAKPIVVLNTGGYYDPLIEMLHRSVHEGFMRDSHASLWTVADTPLEVVETIERELAAGIALAEKKY